MKPWIAGLSSLTAMKHLVLGTIFFTILSQIAPTLWMKYSIYGSLKQRKHELKSTSATITRTSTISKKIPTEAIHTVIRWDSKSLDCAWKSGPTQPPHTVRNFSGLPERYKEMMWPPITQQECGVGSLFRPWLLDNIKHPWMIYIVKSAPHHFMYRNMVRTTWGSISSFYNKTMHVVFLLGMPENRSESWTKALEEENQQYGDILQCPIEDTYRNLPKKVLSSFSWFLKRNYTGTFYTLTDDDCVMRIPNIYIFFDHLTPKEGRNNIYCGFLYDRDNKPIRSVKNKWYVDEELYSETRYPTFCHGGMYTMKKPMMQTIHCMADITNTTGFHLEDVLITGILREKIGEADTNIKKVTTATGKNFDVMYYPWDSLPARSLWKMSHKWSAWNRTLLQYRQRKLLKSKPLPAIANKYLFVKLQSFWKKEWMEILKKKAKQEPNKQSNNTTGEQN